MKIINRRLPPTSPPGCPTAGTQWPLWRRWVTSAKIQRIILPLYRHNVGFIYLFYFFYFSCKDSCQLRVGQCAKMLLCSQPLPHPSFSHVPAPSSSAIVHQGIYYSPGNIGRYCTDIVVVSDTLADMKSLHFLKNILMQGNTFNTPFYDYKLPQTCFSALEFLKKEEFSYRPIWMKHRYWQMMLANQYVAQKLQYYITVSSVSISSPMSF